MSARQTANASGSCTIRLIREHEFGEVGAMLRAAYGGDYDLDGDYLDEITDVGSRAETAEVWVMDDEAGRVLASVTTPLPGRRLQSDTAPDEMDLRLLGVAAEARGRGLARRFMEHCIDLARERGVRRLVLHTASHMVSPQRLYESLGFERIPEREYEFEAQSETRLLMAYGLVLR